MELNDGGGESGKEDREMDVKLEEKEIGKAAETESSSVSKRASTRTFSLLATEKIMKMKDEVYDWEYDRKRRGKRESEKIGGESESEDTNVEDTGLEGEGEKNVEGQSIKRKRGRKRKVVKCEDAGLGVEGEKNVEGQGSKGRRGRKREVVTYEVMGMGVEENVEGQTAKGRPRRKGKVVKSEDSGLGGPAEGEDKSVEDERMQRTPQRTERKSGKRGCAGLQGEEKNVKGQSTTPRQGKKSFTEQEIENGGDDHDNEVDPTHEENVLDSCYLQLVVSLSNLSI